MSTEDGQALPGSLPGTPLKGTVVAPPPPLKPVGGDAAPVRADS